MKYRLVALDIDGVIFRDINFWMELHKRFGTFEEGKALTKEYLHTNYDRLVEEVVVRLWKGKDAKPYYDLVDALEYLPGVSDLFKYIREKSLISALISASALDVARRVQRDYTVDHIFANELVIRNGKVAGEFVWPIGAGKHKKAEIIKDLCRDLNISPKQTIYIGDSDTDIEAFETVGLSIAFNSASEELKRVATHVVDGSDLRKVLKYLPQ